MIKIEKNKINYENLFSVYKDNIPVIYSIRCLIGIMELKMEEKYFHWI